jgi:hypothetical protein
LLDRTVSFPAHQHRDGIQRRIDRSGAVDFFNLLTGPELLEMTESLLPEHRERLYPPTLALSMFMKQALNEDRSCQRAVNDWAAQRVAEGLSVHSVSTGAYCRARARLPLQMMTALTRASGRALCERAKSGWRWRGRQVKLADGTGISMPDTPANQGCFPQPSSQAQGVGFPLARLVGVICLSTGAILEAAIGPHSSKGRSELDLFRSLLAALSPGDMLLADALYCNYFLIARCRPPALTCCSSNTVRVSLIFAAANPSASGHQVHWHKPKIRPNWMSREQYRAFPDQVLVREVRVGGRILVTTLLKPRAVSKRELHKLYERRWNIELDLRCIKTTLRMETLSCKTPEMAQKELWVYLLAYNLIRVLMAQAAHAAGVQPRELSFKHTVQIWTAWTSQTLAALATRHHLELFRLIAQLRVANRPKRVEPRARKRRPKPFPWLKIPRVRARRQIRKRCHRLYA